MRKFSRILALIIVVCMSVSIMTGCQKSEENSASGEGAYKIGYVNLADSDVFCKARKDALIDATKNDTSIELKFSDANNDIQKQLDQTDNFIAQGVDLLILVPCDFAGITPAVEKANAAGIPVICLGIKSEGGDYIFVGSENYEAGKLQGELLKEKLPDGAKVLYLAGTAGMSHSADRRNGFKEVCIDQRSDIELLADLDGNYEMAKGMQITEDWIQSFPKFDAIVAANDQMALGAIQALKAANRLDGVLVTGVDGTADATTAVKNGEMLQTVLQNAPGQAAACYDTMMKILNGESTEKEIIVPFESITIDNVDNFLK